MVNYNPSCFFGDPQTVGNKSLVWANDCPQVVGVFTGDSAAPARSRRRRLGCGDVHRGDFRCGAASGEGLRFVRFELVCFGAPPFPFWFLKKVITIFF